MQIAFNFWGAYGIIPARMPQRTLYLKIRNFFALHWAAIFIACVVGLVSIAPFELAIRALGTAYHGVPYFEVSDSFYYTAKIREVLEGHLFSGSTYFFEYKSAQTVVPPLGEFIYAVPVWVFHAPLGSVILAYKALLPLVLFLLVYGLIWRVCGAEVESRIRRITGLAGGLFVTLGYDLIDFRNIIEFARGHQHWFHPFLWVRPINPILGAILLFGFLYIFSWIAYEEGSHSWRWLAAAMCGVLAGAMVFYIFSWGVALAIVGTYLCFALIQKRWVVALQAGFVLVSSFVVSFSYWHSLFRVIGGTGGSASAAKNGLFLTHAPLFNRVLIGALALFVVATIYLYARNSATLKSCKSWWWYCLAMLFGSFLALNQQIITGRTVWPYHFVQYTIPCAIVVVFVILARVLYPISARVWWFVTLSVILCISIYAATAVDSYKYEVNSMGDLQRYEVLATWLTEHGGTPCVVWPHGEHSALATVIPALSQCDVYTSPWIPLSNVPEDRIMHNYLIELQMNGVTPQSADAYLTAHVSDIRTYFFSDWNDIFGTGQSSFISKKHDEILAAYSTFYAEPVLGELKKYRIDFIAAEEPLRGFTQKEFEQLQPVGDFGGIILYRVAR